MCQILCQISYKIVGTVSVQKKLIESFESEKFLRNKIIKYGIQPPTRRANVFHSILVPTH